MRGQDKTTDSCIQFEYFLPLHPVQTTNKQKN